MPFIALIYKNVDKPEYVEFFKHRMRWERGLHLFRHDVCVNTC